MKIALFATPKAFRGHIGVIQRNAIQSWLQLRPKPTVLLLGDDAGVKEFCDEHGLIHIPKISTDPWGRPLVGPLFAKALARTNERVVAYVNCDIILLQDFVEATGAVRNQTRNFLMVGQRWNLDLRSALDFGEGWQQKLRSQVADLGRLFTRGGIDYFAFSRSLYEEGVPPFVIGQFIWDNWLIYRARSLGAQVVDATKSVLAVHQDHHYEDPQTGRQFSNDQEILKGKAAQENIALAGGWQNAYTLDDATHWLVRGRLRRPPISRVRIFRFVKRLQASSKFLAPLFRAGSGLKSPLRALLLGK